MPAKASWHRLDIFDEMFNKTKDGLIVFDPDGAVAIINPSMERLLGYSREDLRRPDAMFPKLLPNPAEEKQWRAAWKEDLTLAHPGERLVPLTRKDGQKRWFRCQLFSLENGCKFAHLEDISDQKEMERVKESEASFRTLAEQSPNMIFINLKGRVVFANHKCEEIMGYTREELCSPSFDYLSLIAPEYHAPTRENWKQHQAGQEVGSFEYVIVTKQGKRIPAVITTKLIQYHGERALLGIVTDISQLKQVEDRLTLLTRTLREQKKELERKNAALREVLAQIEAEKLDLKRQIAANMDKLIVPALGRLKSRVRPANRRHVDVLESDIRGLVGRFGVELSQSPTKLSIRETEICSMIRSGLSSKEIAEMLHITLRTVTTHRNNIRKKLRLTARGVNLVSHLQALA